MSAPWPTDVPRADVALLPSLATDLSAFTVDAVDAAMGPMAAAALGRDDPVPARRALRGVRSPAAVLAGLWLLGGPVTREALDEALPGTGTDGAERLGLVRSAGRSPDDEVLACVDLRPVESDGATLWLASDLGEVVVGGPLRQDHVLGLGGASATLARWTPRRPVRRALDVGTGSGVQSLYLARHAEAVTSSDVSGRALVFARFNAALNGAAHGPFHGRRLDLRRGNLLEPVVGERFDLVVSNPPFVITPRSDASDLTVPRYEYRDAGLVGDAVVAQLVRGMADVLEPGGVALLLGNWERRANEGWRDRVESWLPSELDAWIVQREVQDAAEYAETWARDGGHQPGTPAYEQLVERYLDDFARRGVDGVGLGVVTLRRPDVGTALPPLRRLEELSGPLGNDGVMGQVVVDVLAAERWLSTVDDDGLLQCHLAVAPDVTEERFGLPGESDPQVVLLRQGGGLRRAVRADTALAGLVGACDGDLSVGQITSALAELLDEPQGQLAERLLHQVRHLVADGLLNR